MLSSITDVTMTAVEILTLARKIDVALFGGLYLRKCETYAGILPVCIWGNEACEVAQTQILVPTLQNRCGHQRDESNFEP